MASLTCQQQHIASPSFNCFQRYGAAKSRLNGLKLKPHLAGPGSLSSASAYHPSSRHSGNDTASHKRRFSNTDAPCVPPEHIAAQAGALPVHDSTCARGSPEPAHAALYRDSLFEEWTSRGRAHVAAPSPDAVLQSQLKASQLERDTIAAELEHEKLRRKVRHARAPTCTSVTVSSMLHGLRTSGVCASAVETQCTAFCTLAQCTQEHENESAHMNKIEHDWRSIRAMQANLDRTRDRLSAALEAKRQAAANAGNPYSAHASRARSRARSHGTHVGAAAAAGDQTTHANTGLGADLTEHEACVLAQQQGRRRRGKPVDAHRDLAASDSDPAQDPGRHRSKSSNRRDFASLVERAERSARRRRSAAAATRAATLAQDAFAPNEHSDGLPGGDSSSQIDDDTGPDDLLSGHVVTNGTGGQGRRSGLQGAQRRGEDLIRAISQRASRQGEAAGDGHADIAKQSSKKSNESGSNHHEELRAALAGVRNSSRGNSGHQRRELAAAKEAHAASAVSRLAQETAALQKQLSDAVAMSGAQRAATQGLVRFLLNCSAPLLLARSATPLRISATVLYLMISAIWCRDCAVVAEHNGAAHEFNSAY